MKKMSSDELENEFEELGFVAHYVRTNPLIVLPRFFKSARLRGVSAKNAVSFLQPGFPKTSGAEFWGFAELFSLRL